MVLHLHRPGHKGKIQEDDLKSPYDGWSIEATIVDFQEKPSAENGVYDDKDDDKGDIC